MSANEIIREKVEEIIKLVKTTEEYEEYTDIQDIVDYSLPVYLSNCCTEDQIDRILDVTTNNLDNYDLLKTFKELGILSCKLQLYKNSIIFGLNKYLHWFRGYYFQISSTPNGIGSMATSLTRLDVALRHCRDNFKSKECRDLLFITGALIPSYNYFTTFAEFIETSDGKNLFNEFLNIARENEPYCSDNLDVSVVFDRIELTKTKNEPKRVHDIGSCCSIVESNRFTDIPIATLCINRNFIEVVWKDKSKEFYYTCKFSIPEDLFTLDDCEYNIDILIPAYMMLIEFVLSYCGFRVYTSSIYSYNRGRFVKDAPLKTNVKTVVKDYCDISDFVKIYFNKLL